MRDRGGWIAPLAAGKALSNRELAGLGRSRVIEGEPGGPGRPPIWVSRLERVQVRETYPVQSCGPAEAGARFLRPYGPPPSSLQRRYSSAGPSPPAARSPQEAKPLSPSTVQNTCSSKCRPMNYYIFLHFQEIFMVPPYHGKSIVSSPICEIKLRWAGLVLR